MPRFSESFKRERGETSTSETSRTSARGARVDGNVGRGGRTALVSPPVVRSLRDRVDLLVRVGEDLTKLALCPAMLPGTVERSAVRTEVLSEFLLRLRESISSCFRHHGDRRGGDHDVARAKSECRISKRFSISRARSEDLPLFESARLPNWGKVHSTSTSSRVWV